MTTRFYISLYRHTGVELIRRIGRHEDYWIFRDGSFQNDFLPNVIIECAGIICKDILFSDFKKERKVYFKKKTELFR